MVVQENRIPGTAKKSMYYLWESSTSKPGRRVLYVTDYKEVRADGKVKIDNYGYLQVKEIFASTDKAACIAFAQALS